MRTGKKDIVMQFNDCINNRDMERLTALMTGDHVFIDSAGNRHEGKAAMKESWNKFFAAFPDYKNVFEHVEETGDTVLMTGYSICPNNNLLDGPAIWTAKVRGEYIAEWRVYDDTPENRKRLGITPNR